MTLLDDMLFILEEAGVGQGGETLFNAEMPANPDKCLALYATPGAPPIERQDFEDIESPGLQIITRSRNGKEAYQLAYDALRALRAVKNRSINGTFYQSVDMQSSPATLGPDENQRHEVSANFSVRRNMPA